MSTETVPPALQWGTPRYPNGDGHPIVPTMATQGHQPAPPPSDFTPRETEAAPVWDRGTRPRSEG